MQAIQKFRTLIQRPGKCTTRNEEYDDSKHQYDVNISPCTLEGVLTDGGHTYRTFSSTPSQRRHTSGYTNSTCKDVRRYSSVYSSGTHTDIIPSTAGATMIPSRCFTRRYTTQQHNHNTPPHMTDGHRLVNVIQLEGIVEC